jgi:putative oxidoreductase
MLSTRSHARSTLSRRGMAAAHTQVHIHDEPASAASSVGGRLHRIRAVEYVVTAALQPRALPLLRILLGVLFVWFGALKVANVSPVAALVAGTMPWADRGLVVPVLGGVEVVLGLGLVSGRMLRLVLPALAAHLAGTFLTFAMLPQLMFRHDDPLLLTADGEFVMKNLVLISATLVLIAHTASSHNSARAALTHANAATTG